MKIVILYKRNTEPDGALLGAIDNALRQANHEVFIDRHLKIGVEWARAIEERIRTADAVIVLLSDAALGSEMLEYEVEIASDEFLRRGKPGILPIRIGTDQPATGLIGSLLNSRHFSVWHRASDNPRVVAEVLESLDLPPPAKGAIAADTLGGAVPPESPFYIERPVDREFEEALSAGESILLVRGARQVGKTSLLGRGVRKTKALGWRKAVTDYQKLSSTLFSDEDACYRMIAANLARQLRFHYDFDGEWHPMYGSNSNLDNFLRALLEGCDQPFVWFMDEADRLFAAPFATDFFALVRSWHNARATEPDGPWDRFSVAIAYATEAHLFIQDLNQSPFNVGHAIELRGFTLRQTQELNERYGIPLRGIDQVQVLYDLVDGQPFLSRRAMEVLAKTSGNLQALLAKATTDDGPFGDHLKRVLVSVCQLRGVQDVVRKVLANEIVPESPDAQRLVAAGILVKRHSGGYAMRCKLYRQYLDRHLLDPVSARPI